MSIELMAALFWARLDPMDKLVALKLADHANADGIGIYPSVATVSFMTGLSRRSVQSAMRDLEGMGILAVVREATPKTPREYRMDPIVVYRMAQEGRSDRGAAGAPLEFLGAQQVHGRGAAGAPNPSVEPSEKEHATLSLKAKQQSKEPELFRQERDPSPQEPPPPPSKPDPFERAWAIFPKRRRDSLAACKPNWLRALKAEPDPEKIIAGIAAYAGSTDAAADCGACSMQTFLNQQRWLRQYQAVSSVTENRTPTGRLAQGIQRLLPPAPSKKTAAEYMAELNADRAGE